MIRWWKRISSYREAGEPEGSPKGHIVLGAMVTSLHILQGKPASSLDPEHLKILVESGALGYAGWRAAGR